MTKAIHIEDKSDFRLSRVPGSFRCDAVDNDGTINFWYCCPCGCGRIGMLEVGNNFKPSEQPSWEWNGSFDTPTLKPSVHHVGHWHGFLTNGEWKIC